MLIIDAQWILLEIVTGPRAWGRAGLMAMASEEKHCDELRMADDMERRMRLTVRSGGRGDALDALPHHSTENTQRSLALTSPIPQLRGRRAWIPVARREGESAALTSGPRLGVTRA